MTNGVVSKHSIEVSGGHMYDDQYSPASLITEVPVTSILVVHPSFLFVKSAERLLDVE